MAHANNCSSRKIGLSGAILYRPEKCDCGRESADKRDAKRYRWLRSHLEYINFDGLTTDTCDVGLDHAIDSKI